MPDRPPLLPHGTNAAYARHIKDKTEPCDLCRKAHRESVKAWRKKLSVKGHEKGYKRSVYRRLQRLTGPLMSGPRRVW